MTLKSLVGVVHGISPKRIGDFVDMQNEQSPAKTPQSWHFTIKDIKKPPSDALII